MSIKKLRLHGSVSSRGEASDHITLPGDAVVIERGRPRWLLLACPCGCGEKLPINLDPRAGPAWRIYRRQRSGVSLFPSVWRESGCKSHFVIWRNKIFLFGIGDANMDDPLQDAEMDALRRAVYERLSERNIVSYTSIAESLDAVPWDVLNICRQLVRSGLAREGKDKQRGSFGRASTT